MIDTNNPDWDCPRLSPEEDAKRQRDWDDWQREIAAQNWYAYLRKEAEIEKESD